MIAELLTVAAISFWSDRAGDPDVFTMAVDGSDVRNLGTRDWGDKRASWSPDGTQLAYDSWHFGERDFDIWVMNADGSGKRQLTTSPLRDVLPSWSPDGRWIAFTCKRARSLTEDVWLIHPDGSGEHLYVRRASGGAWSPDSRRFVYSLGGDMYLGRKRLTRTRAYEAVATGAWSPDGRRSCSRATRSAASATSTCSTYAQVRRGASHERPRTRATRHGRPTAGRSCSTRRATATARST